ncbi:MAG: SH3 domain-containing protein, partial [Thermomicrobiales bacterium]
MVLDPYANQQINVDAYLVWCAARGAKRLNDLREYVATLNRDGPKLQLNPALAAAQSLHECADRETASKVYVSVPWTYGLNPAGIGVESDALWRVYDFKTGEHAARVQLLQLHIYFHGVDLPDGFSASESPRWPVTVAAKPSRIASTTTVAGLSGTWAVDKNYAAGIETWYQRILAAGLLASAPKPLPEIPSTEGEPTVTTYTTVVPGLPGGPLVTDYTIDTSRMIPSWNTRQRPGIKARDPRQPVQHGNGNGNSSRLGEVNYVVGGAEGRQASYHSVGSDDGISVVMPVDEVSWQAADGAGPGNMNGFSMEAVEDRVLWANPARALRLIHNCGDFMGRLAARFAGKKTPGYHWDYNYMLPASERHDCPEKIRHGTVNGKPAKPIYEAEFYSGLNSELQRMGGAPVDTTPLKAGDGFAVTEALNLRRDPSTIAEIITVLAAGDTGTITGASKTADLYTWWPVKTASGATGWVAADWIEKTTSAPTTTQPPAPVYAEPMPILALLDTDVTKNDTAEGVESADGTDFVFVSDVIEVT